MKSNNRSKNLESKKNTIEFDCEADVYLLPLLNAVEPVMFGLVKLCWKDGYEGVVDLRPVIADGDMFAFLRNQPSHFNSVQLGELGHAIFWLDEAGDEIGFSSNALRKKAERQAEIVRLAS